MSEIPDSAQTTDTPIQMTMLDIPEGRIDEVLAFVQKLREEEAEVAGYGTTLTTKGYTSGSQCKMTQNGKDFTCGDSDQGSS